MLGLHSHIEGSPYRNHGRNLVQELMERPWRELLPGLLTGFLTEPNHQPRDSTTHNKLDLPPSITNQKNALQACLHSLNEDIFLVEGPSDDLLVSG